MGDTWVSLHVERRGDGPPLVLLHGGVGSSNHWVRNIDVFAEHFSVYAVDLPGLGRSPDVPRDISREDYLDVCTRGIEAHLPPGEPVRLVGFSYGGVIGSHVAGELGDRLECVSLISPGGLRQLRGGEPRYLKMPPEDAPKNEIDKVVRHNLLQLMLHHPESISDETIALHCENVRNSRFHSRNLSVRISLLENLRRIGAPLQVLLGEHDTVLYPSHEERIRAMRMAAPHLRLDMIPGAGHWMQYERSETVNRVLLEFLTEGL